MPPLFTVTDPTVPVPASVPLLFTVMGELASVPFTASMPALIAQGSAAAFVPVSVQVLLPVFANSPKPRYCAPAPICETSKLALLVPPSASVSAAVNATTLPMMVEPDCRVRLLVPPLKVMALARVTPLPETPPKIMPLLVTVRLAPTMPAPPRPGLPLKVVPLPPLPPLPPLMVPPLMTVSPEPTMPAPPAPPLPPIDGFDAIPGAVPPAPPAPPVIVPVFVRELAVPTKSRPIPPLPPPPPRHAIVGVTAAPGAAVATGATCQGPAAGKREAATGDHRTVAARATTTATTDINQSRRVAARSAGAAGAARKRARSRNNRAMSPTAAHRRIIRCWHRRHGRRWRLGWRRRYRLRRH